jgi:Cu(I)/Ag(I) efflux system membrane protein CusA/SilA
MQRIAVPMVGGMISSTILTLIVIPVIYALIKQREAKVAWGKDAGAQIGIPIEQY